MPPALRVPASDPPPRAPEPTGRLVVAGELGRWVGLGLASTWAALVGAGVADRLPRVPAPAVPDGIGVDVAAAVLVAVGTVGAGVGFTVAVRVAVLGVGVAVPVGGGVAPGAKSKPAVVSGDPGPPGTPEFGPLLLPLLTPANKTSHCHAML